MLTEAATNEQRVNGITSLSVVIPVYNQERNVAMAIKGITGILDQVLIDYEIVVVNDGSTDNTLSILRKLQDTNSNLQILSYTPNKGKGYAVKQGVMQSKGSMVFFIDGDLDITPHSIQEYIVELQTYDLVVASKRHPESIVKAPTSRVFLSKTFNLLVRLLVGTNIKDTQAGLKAGRGALLRAAFSMISIDRYAFDVELLLIAKLSHARVKEMPVHIELTKRFKFSEILKMLYDVVGISIRYRFARTYQKRIENDFDSYASQ